MRETIAMLLSDLFPSLALSDTETQPLLCLWSGLCLSAERHHHQEDVCHTASETGSRFI